LSLALESAKMFLKALALGPGQDVGLNLFWQQRKNITVFSKRTFGDNHISCIR